MTARGPCTRAVPVLDCSFFPSLLEAGAWVSPTCPPQQGQLGLPVLPVPAPLVTGSTNLLCVPCALDPEGQQASPPEIVAHVWGLTQKQPSGTSSDSTAARDRVRDSMRPLGQRASWPVLGPSSALTVSQPPCRRNAAVLRALLPINRTEGHSSQGDSLSLFSVTALHKHLCPGMGVAVGRGD